MSSTPISNRQTKRDRALGFGLSACLHLAALLLLSLISLNVGSSLGSKLTFTQTLDSQASLDQMPAFELESPVAELLESPSRPGLSMDLQLAAAQPQAHSSTLATQIALAAAIAEQPESPAAAAQASSSTIPQAGAAIQARVGKAGGKTGEVQFALAWANINDVDLHVIAPSGERISHLHRRSQCKGMLDVDMNVDGESNEPVENIRWISGAPWGRYTVLVNMFQVHRGAPSARSEFELLAELGSILESDRAIRIAHGPSRRVSLFLCCRQPAHGPA